MANQDPDATATVTIKGLRVETWQLAKASATRAGLPMAAWLDQAIHSQSRLDTQGAVLPPPAVTRSESPAPAAADFAALRDLMQAAAAAAQASGRPMSGRAAGRLYGLVDNQVRATAGLPARKLRTPRQPPLRIAQAAE